MANKRPSMDDKNLDFDDEYDTLFKNEPIRSKTKKENSKEDDEPRLRNHKTIRDYYRSNKRRKQVSIYLPEEIQQKLKSKASEDDKSVSEVIKDLILDHYFNDDEMKSAYDKGYDKRHPNDI